MNDIINTLASLMTMDTLKAYLDHAIFAILGLMSFIMLAFVIERYVYFWRVRLDGFEQQESLHVSLTKHLTAISSVASNAPYIGLLGTVLGILVTFHDMGQAGKVDVDDIMLGLAMALKATALGLLVAIPAMMFYNALMRKVDVLTARWKTLQPKADTLKVTEAATA